MKLFHGDCLEVMRKMEDSSIDLVVTSPPYDNLRQYHGFAWDFNGIALELSRIIKPGGVIVWVVGDQTDNGCESLTSFKQAIFFVDHAKLKLYDTMLYQKHGMPTGGRRYESEFEYMFILSKGMVKTFNPIMINCLWAGKKQKPSVCASSFEKEGKQYGVRKAHFTKDKKIKGNIWKYAIGYGNSSSDSIAFDHPAVFPEKLAADHILSWSNEGDIVLDPFAGSGTTLKMAELLKRQSIGIEISGEYCDLIRRRLNPDQMRLSL